jgi:hypothetical protein
MRKLIFVLIFIFTISVLWINFKLYSENFTTEEKRKDIILQLNFIGTELKSNNLGNRMQEVFPEGFVFTNALYGLSWCELANSDATDSELKSKALKEAIFAYNEINSDEAKSIFDSHLTPENGIYYVGWKNYLLSNILKLDTTFADFSRLKTTFSEQCNIINEALKQSNSPYLQSYDSQSWAADMFLAMASLKNHDNIFKPKYENEISEWIKNAKNKLDPKTKLIPHKVNSRTGATVEGARGSSISLIIRLLAEIEPNFAKEQYELYKTYFVTTTFGLPSIIEYPKGQSGDGDIDSGPVIFGVGFSGTIVSIGTFAKLGNFDLAEQQYKTINAFGFGNKSENGKKYVFGLMPIADAFIAWGRATELNIKNTTKPASITWRVKFHLISIVVLLILWTILYSKSILTKWRNSK